MGQFYVKVIRVSFNGGLLKTKIQSTKIVSTRILAQTELIKVKIYNKEFCYTRMNSVKVAHSNTN
jgi:hypothetical protein